MRGTWYGTHRDEANAGRQNQRPRETAHARVSLFNPPRSNACPKPKKPNDASIKNFLCQINVLSYTLLVAMTEVGSMRRIEINAPHVSPQTKYALKSPNNEPTQYQSIKESDAMKQTQTAVT